MIDAELAVRLLGATAAVAAVLGVLATALRFAVRRGAGARGKHLIRVLETAALPNATALHAIAIGDDTCVVIARSAHHVGVVCEVRPETLAAWRASRSAPAACCAHVGAACPRGPRA